MSRFTPEEAGECSCHNLLEREREREREKKVGGW
jgi:hypothetical protein